MITDKQLAELIFPEVTTSLLSLEEKYPPRNLKEGAEVTRFAPSPTGFLHLGSLFTSMICRKVATQSGGVFYIRLEDTDTKREVEGSGKQLLEQLHIFGVNPDEGYLGDHEEGQYGPYKQSDRADIYKVAIKYLISIGRAYPCFCSPEEIDEIRAAQEKEKLTPGYYGEFAKCRFLDNDEKARRIQNGEPFVIRFKSNGDHNNKIPVSDLVRGNFEIAQNDQDIVIYKSDGLPTYHFAHCVDDHFMRTTTVIRGEEWIASLPIHVELFEAMGWKAPNYCHVPVIMKLDENNGNKRKLSKRLDKEAAVSYFIEDGYPPKAVIMYLMTIANSNFEEWILKNKFSNMEDFTFAFNKMNHEGALFDMGKVNFFSKEILAKMKIDEIFALTIEYANKYNPELKALIDYNPEYLKAIMNIERDKDNPRKDYDKLGDVVSVTALFYDDKYEKMLQNGLAFNEKFSSSDIKEVLEAMKNELSLDQDEQSWFNNMKEVGEKLGYAPNGKLYKQNPDNYKGSVSDVAEMLRIALTTKKNSPNLYYVMKLLTKEGCDKRINLVISLLK